MVHSTQIHTVNSPAAEYLAGWQRARAELNNLQLRMAREQGSLKERALEEIISPLLSLADNFNSMANHVPPEFKDHAWTEGVLHVSRQLAQILASFDVTEIKPDQNQFDPAFHEAVKEAKSPGSKKGQIVEVIQVGYKIGDRIIRPAKVTVAK